MNSSVMPSHRDLRTLAGIVSDHRADLPKDGLPLSLLAELMGQIRCDIVAFHGYDSERQQTLFLQHLPGGEDLVVEEDYNALHWQHYWNCQPCSYPDRTGDLRSIVKPTDFYSGRQWHSTGMYCDMYRPWGNEHDLMLTLPAASSPVSEPGRTVRLFFSAGPERTFPSMTGRCWCCCARTCTRPISTPNAAATALSPSSPAGTGTCCAWSPPGTPTPRSPAVSAYLREPCGPTWKPSTPG